MFAALAAGVLVSGAPAAKFTDQAFMTPTGVIGKPYSHQFTGRDGCGPALPYSYKILNGALPPGLSLASSGLVSGTPTQAGKYSFWVEISDQNPPSQSWCNPDKSEREFSITIAPRLLIGPESAGPGTVGTSYSLAMSASIVYSPTQIGPPSGPIAWSLTGGQLPPGLALGADGVISGLPTVAGSFSFTILGVLDAQSSDTKALSIVVRDPVTIAAPTSFGAAGAAIRWEVGVPFSATLTATGGTGAYTWTLAAGALPAGLALTADGSIAGRPQVAGTFGFTATATDTENRAASYTGQMVVAQRLAIVTRSLRPGMVGRAYRAKLVSTGGVLPKVWRIKRGPLPRGLSFDPTLGILAGTPLRPRSYRIIFEIRDELGVKSMQTVLLKIAAAPKKQRG